MCVAKHSPDTSSSSAWLLATLSPLRGAGVALLCAASAIAPAIAEPPATPAPRFAGVAGDFIGVVALVRTGASCVFTQLFLMPPPVFLMPPPAACSAVAAAAAAAAAAAISWH